MQATVGRSEISGSMALELLLTLVLTFNQLSSTSSASSGIGSAVAEVVSAGVETGLQTAAESSGYSVTCGIEVNNLSPFTLSDPVARPVQGHIASPPADVLPGEEQGILAHKKSNTWTGTYGTLSWLVEEKNVRLVIMWHVPFDSNLFSNYLSVGLTSNGSTIDPNNDDWFNDMYDNEGSGNSGNLKFFTRKYDEAVLASTYISESDNLTVVGTMGTSGNPIARITLREGVFPTRSSANHISHLTSHALLLLILLFTLC